jgi:hypothetical protein
MLNPVAMTMASWVHLLEGLIIYVAGFTVGMPF